MYRKRTSGWTHWHLRTWMQDSIGQNVNTLLYNGVLESVNDYTGVDNPKWRQSIKEKRSASTSFAGNTAVVVYEKGSAETRHRQTKTGYWFIKGSDAFMPLPYKPSRPDDQSLISEASFIAKTAVIKKIKNHMGFSGPTMIGELKETIQWLKSPAKSLRTIFYGFWDKQIRIAEHMNETISRAATRRKKRKIFDRWSKDFADNYLELTFAVKPLLGSIKDISEALLYKVQLDTLTRISASCPRQSASYSSYTSPQQVGNTPIWYKWRTLYRDDVSVQWVAWVREAPSAGILSATERLYKSAHMNLSEIPSVMWELTWMSWAFDYFTNIGDLLACNFDYNAQVAFAQEVTRYQALDYIEYDIYNVVSPGYVSDYFVSQAPYLLTQKRTVRRTPANNLGAIAPRLILSVPGTSNQFLNLASVARQFIDKFSNIRRP